MQSISLKLVSNDFVRNIRFKLNYSVFNLKEAIGENDDFDPKRYNLLLVRTSELLEDANSLEFYKLQNGDEIFVVKPPRYSVPSRLPNSSEGKLTQKDIDEATKDIEPKNFDIEKTIRRDGNEPLQRQVFISLIEIAQNILCLNKTASNLFTFVHEEINRESVQESELVQADLNLISKLMEMGFSREVAENALIRSNNSLNSALNMVFTQTENEGYGNDDNNASRSNNNGNRNKDAEMEIQWLRDTKGQSFIKPMKGSVILKLYRDYNRKFFRPFTAARERLVDMGFDEFEVNEALRLNNNNESAAIDQIISRTIPALEQVQEILEGVPNDSLVIETILSNAEIQVGLLNIYSLLAFLNIVDNPKNLPHWLANPETKQILQQIINIVNDFETANKLYS